MRRLVEVMVVLALGGASALAQSGNQVEAEFSGTPIFGDVPLTVQYVDESTGPVVAWRWDFGDNNTSTEQDPGHTYQQPGRFAVGLTVWGKPFNGQDTEIKGNYIWVNPDAEFTGSPRVGAAPLTVHFTNQTVEGFNMRYWWYFGDGQTSTEREPVHTYQQAGRYSVVLFAYADSLPDVEHKTDYVTVRRPPIGGGLAATGASE